MLRIAATAAGTDDQSDDPLNVEQKPFTVNR